VIAPTVPEDVWLRLRLLGLKAVWEQIGWSIYPEGMGNAICFVHGMDIIDGWDEAMEQLANKVCRNKRPIGWVNTQRVDTVPITAAAVIDEENFK